MSIQTIYFLVSNSSDRYLCEVPNGGGAVMWGEFENCIKFTSKRAAKLYHAAFQHDADAHIDSRDATFADVDRLNLLRKLCFQREKERDEAQRRNQQLESQLQEANARAYKRASAVVEAQRRIKELESQLQEARDRISGHRDWSVELCRARNNLKDRDAEIQMLRTKLRETSIRLTAVEAGRSPKVVDKRRSGGACYTVALVHDLQSGDVEIHDDYYTVGTVGKPVGSERVYVPVPKWIDHDCDLGAISRNVKKLAAHMEKFRPDWEDRFVVWGISNNNRPGGLFVLCENGELEWSIGLPDTAMKFNSHWEAADYLVRCGPSLPNLNDKSKVFEWDITCIGQSREAINRAKEGFRAIHKHTTPP